MKRAIKQTQKQSFSAGFSIENLIEKLTAKDRVIDQKSRVIDQQKNRIAQLEAYLD